MKFYFAGLDAKTSQQIIAFPSFSAVYLDVFGTKQILIFRLTTGVHPITYERFSSLAFKEFASISGQGDVQIRR
jgi:hypothetical protein